MIEYSVSGSIDGGDTWEDFIPEVPHYPSFCIEKSHSRRVKGPDRDNWYDCTVIQWNMTEIKQVIGFVLNVPESSIRIREHHETFTF